MNEIIIAIFEVLVQLVNDHFLGIWCFFLVEWMLSWDPKMLSCSGVTAWSSSWHRARGAPRSSRDGWENAASEAVCTTGAWSERLRSPRSTLVSLRFQTKRYQDVPNLRCGSHVFDAAIRFGHGQCFAEGRTETTEPVA